MRNAYAMKERAVELRLDSIETKQDMMARDVENIKGTLSDVLEKTQTIAENEERHFAEMQDSLESQKKEMRKFRQQMRSGWLGGWKPKFVLAVFVLWLLYIMFIVPHRFTYQPMA